MAGIKVQSSRFRVQGGVSRFRECRAAGTAMGIVGGEPDVPEAWVSAPAVVQKVPRP